MFIVTTIPETKMSLVIAFTLVFAAAVLCFTATAEAAPPFDPPTAPALRAERALADTQNGCKTGYMRIVVGCKPVILFDAMNEQRNCLAHAVDAADFLNREHGIPFDKMSIVVGKTNGDLNGLNHAILMVRIGSTDWVLDQGGLGYWLPTGREVCPENVCLAKEALRSLFFKETWDWPLARAVDARQRREVARLKEATQAAPEHFK